MVGDEPFEAVEIAGIYGYGRPIPRGESFVPSVLFTDLVDSTAALERLGDLQFRRLFESHFEAARRELDRWRGVEIGTTGDGLLATFDSAARAIRCAAGMHGSAPEAAVSALRSLSRRVGDPG